MVFKIKKIENKKGVSAYMSWVILTAFMVSLSSFIYFWMSEHVENQTEQIQTRADENLCQTTGITIIDACQDDYSLKLNITNSKNIQIQELKITLFDLYDTSLTLTQELDLKPSESKKLDIIKHGTLAQAEITPKISKSNKEFYCEDSKTILTTIKYC